MRLPHAGALIGCMVLLPLFGLLEWVTRPEAGGERPAGEPAWQTEQERFDREIEERMRVIMRGYEVKAAIGRDLANGTLTLLEAASKTRDLHRDDPEFLTIAFRCRHPTMSDAERYCREILNYVPNRRSGGQNLDTSFERYDAELAEHLERGTLRLVDRSSDE
jgi:hypothetical protein